MTVKKKTVAKSKPSIQFDQDTAESLNEIHDQISTLEVDLNTIGHTIGADLADRIRRDAEDILAKAFADINEKMYSAGVKLRPPTRYYG